MIEQQEKNTIKISKILKAWVKFIQHLSILLCISLIKRRLIFIAIRFNLVCKLQTKISTISNRNGSTE